MNVRDHPYMDAQKLHCLRNIFKVYYCLQLHHGGANTSVPHNFPRFMSVHEYHHRGVRHSMLHNSFPRFMSVCYYRHGVDGHFSPSNFFQPYTL